MGDREVIAGESGIGVEGLATAGLPSPVVSAYPGFADELRRFVLGVVRDRSLADDVMQATFLKAVERGHEARAETAKGWLFRVAWNEALAARRRQAGRDRHERRLAGIRPRDDPGPDAWLIRGETVEAVRGAIAGLPEEQRRVVLARIYEDKTFAEIAGESGLPIGTVLTRMRRALERLRRTLKPGA